MVVIDIGIRRQSSTEISTPGSAFSWDHLLHSYCQLLNSNRQLQLPSSQQKNCNGVSLPFKNSSISRYGDRYNWCTKGSDYWIPKVPSYVTQNCTSPGHYIAIATKFGTVAPNICGPSVSCHPCGARNFEVAPNFLFNLCIPVFHFPRSARFERRPVRVSVCKVTPVQVSLRIFLFSLVTTFSLVLHTGVLFTYHIRCGGARWRSG
jgi:hypothetical protein